MRTYEEIAADAAAESPFSNSTEYEIWADSGRGCYDCRHDDAETDTFCPILSAALLSTWPKEWTRRTVDWQIGDASGSYETVGECTEFQERRDDGEDEPEPEPDPPPVIDGQVDLFEVFADQIAEQSSRVAVTA